MRIYLIALLAVATVACSGKVNEPAEINEVVEVPPLCKVIPEGEVNLPEDEGPHSEDVEWWYWTGHLQDEEGNWYGFEHVFFQFDYNGSTILMAHHAITDEALRTHNYDVEFGFNSGVTDTNPGFSMTLGSMQAEGALGQDTIHGEIEGRVLDLEMVATKAPVLQHGNGYHDYNFGGYTYYYTRPRMKATGTMLIGDKKLSVSGTAWFDHQWGALNDAVSVGWDWFALQLDDQREIMLFNLREDGGDVLAGGSLTEADCQTSELDPSSVTITPLGTWHSDESGCTYPMGWTLTVDGMELTITPLMKEQELINPSQTYWEGAAIISGDATGRAYIELTGYCP